MRVTRFSGAAALAACLAAAGALAGCGGGSKGSGTTAAVSTPPAPTAQPTQTVTAPPTATTNTPPPTPTQTAPSPSTQPSGGGGSTNVSTQALFTGSGGDITPKTVSVPPYIAVRVVLRTGDGGSYAVTVNHHELEVSGSHRTASVLLGGLRPGARYAVDITGAPERLSIVANAEPGP